MKAESRERLRIVQGALGALTGVCHDNAGLASVIENAANHVMKVLDDEKITESEEQQCKE